MAPKRWRRRHSPYCRRVSSSDEVSSGGGDCHRKKWRVTWRARRCRRAKRICKGGTALDRCCATLLNKMRAKWPEHGRLRLALAEVVQAP